MSTSRDDFLTNKQVPGLKHFLNQKFGYPANPRLPLPAMSNNASSNFSENKYVKEIMASEKALGL